MKLPSFNQMAEVAQSPMLEYRAYSVNRSGRIVGRTYLLCENDEDAIRQAIALAHVHSVELWKKDKFIARFEAFSNADRGS